MTTYLGEKAVGVGTIKTYVAVADVLHDNTLVGNGNTEPLGVNTKNIVSQQTLANTISVLNTAIDGQADAIAKTRNDFEVADQEIRADMNEKDSELEHMITEHAEELTTLRGNQASLGDQVSNIESKIPQSASDTNPLVTKQQLLDEEMDIRDDYNELVSELQTQITAQAGAIAGKQDKLTAGDNITIEDGVISATGGGAGGDYLPLSGGTLTGNLDIAISEYKHPSIQLRSAAFGRATTLTSDYATLTFRIGFSTPGGSSVDYYAFSPAALYPLKKDQTMGATWNPWTNVYTTKLNNGADIAIPTTGGTMALKEDIDAAVGDISTALTAILGE